MVILSGIGTQSHVKRRPIVTTDIVLITASTHPTPVTHNPGTIPPGLTVSLASVAVIVRGLRSSYSDAAIVLHTR